jgi:hypothetical protein
MPPSNDVATKSRIVVDPNTGTTRQIIAGQPIPPDLVGAQEGTSVVEAGHEGPPAAARDEVVEVPNVGSCSDEELDAYVKDANVKDLVKLGEGKEAAQRVLDAEGRVHGDKARKGVVEPLQAVLAAE